MQRKDLERIRDNFNEKLAYAKDSRERNKYIGELLECLVREILKDKGYGVYPHAVEKRTEPDIHASNGLSFIMEIGNLKKFAKSGKPEFYAKQKIKRSIRNMKRYAKPYGIDRFYFLVSYASILKQGKDELKRAKVKILEIGSQVTPQNLIGIYPKLRNLLDKHIQDIKIEEEEWEKKARPIIFLIRENGTIEELRS